MPAPHAAAPAANGGTVVAVASGHGSPGRSTVALSLAAALGAVAPTVLVDADTSGPSLAAMLDADPTRNLSMAAHAASEGAGDARRAVEAELQPLGARSPVGHVLCGVPKPEMRGALPPDLFRRLLAGLAARSAYVVLDVGADLHGEGGEIHRTAVACSDTVLLVASGDVVGLLHAQRALGVLRSGLCVPSERVALVLNRHDPRFHHGRAEVEWALQAPVAAIVPHDHAGAQAALAAQRPLLVGGGPAARVLLDLAARLHQGRIELPRTEPARAERFAHAVRRLGSSISPRAGQSTAWPAGRLAVSPAHAAPASAEGGRRDAA